MPMACQCPATLRIMGYRDLCHLGLRHSFASIANDLGFTEVTIAALVGHAKGSVTSKYIHTLDTALIMAADTISGYIQGLLDGIEFKQTAYALDRDSQKGRPGALPKESFEWRPTADRAGVPIGGLVRVYTSPGGLALVAAKNLRGATRRKKQPRTGVPHRSNLLNDKSEDRLLP